MSQSANVLSIQTLKDFKIAMINFGEEARQRAQRRRHGAAADARLARARPARLLAGAGQAPARGADAGAGRSAPRKISQQGSDAVSDAEQKEALRDAQRRLRTAEEKVALIKKKLIPLLHHAIAEYHSHSQPLGDHLSGGFERSIAGMEKMIAALESYLAMRVPTAPRFESGRNPGRCHDRGVQYGGFGQNSGDGCGNGSARRAAAE